MDAHASPPLTLSLPHLIVSLLYILHLLPCVRGTQPGTQKPIYNVVVWADRWPVPEVANLAAHTISASDSFAFGLNVSLDRRLSNDTARNNAVEVFQAYKRARQLPGGVVGIIGPPFSTQLVAASLACMDGIPILPVRSTGGRAIQSASQSFDTLFQLPMTVAFRARALAAVVLHYGWKQVGVVHDFSTYATDIDIDLEFATGGGVIVSATSCETDSGCSAALSELHDVRNVNVFIVLAEPAVTRTILESAYGLNLLSKPSVAWLGTETLGETLAGLAPDVQATYTGVAEVSPEPGSLALETEMMTTWLAQSPTTFPVSRQAPPEAFIVWDAVHSLAHAIQAQQGSSSPSFQSAPVGIPGDTWAQGSNMKKALSALQFDGVSGPIDLGARNTRAALPYRMRMWNGQGGWTNALRLTNMGTASSGGADDSRSSESAPYSRSSSHVSALAVSVKEMGKPLWPGSTLVVPDGSGLSGMTLKVAVGPYPPFTIIDDEQTNQVSGFSVDILREAAKEHGFLLEIFAQGVGGSSALLRNVTTENNISGTIFDVALFGFAINGDRFPNPDTYSFPFSQYSMRLVVPKARHATSALLFGFFGPFHWGVWLACFGTVLVSAGLLWIFESGSAVRPGRSGCLQVLQESFSSCIGGNGTVVSPKELKSASAKLLFFSQRWFALVLLSSYTALLAANLVVIQSRRGIETWEDVADKKIGVYGGGLSQVIASQHATDLKLIQAGKDYEHEIDAMLDVVNGKLDALAMHPIRAEYIIRHNERLCGLEVIAEPRGTLPCSMIFRPSLNPAVKRAIDSTITRLRAKDGSPLREMVKKYVAGGDVCPAGNSVEDILNSSQQYEISDLYGIFLLFYAVCIGVGIPLHFFEKHGKRGRFKVRRGQSAQKQANARAIELTVMAGGHDGTNTPSASTADTSQPPRQAAPSRFARLALVRSKSRERMNAGADKYTPQGKNVSL